MSSPAGRQSPSPPSAPEDNTTEVSPPAAEEQQEQVAVPLQVDVRCPYHKLFTYLLQSETS